MRATVAWGLLVVVLAVVGAVLVVPGWRSPVVVVASVLSPLLVLTGVWLHRPASAVWWLLSLMLALWVPRRSWCSTRAT